MDNSQENVDASDKREEYHGRTETHRHEMQQAHGPTLNPKASITLALEP